MEQDHSDDEKIRIMREELVKEMDTGFDHVDKILDETRKDGILGSMMNSIEKFVFSYFARDSVRGKTLRQMDIIFEAAKLYKEGVDMNTIGKKYFKEYMENDETYHRCYKKHPRFRDIGNYIKESFESRVKQTSEILKRGKGKTYKDLVLTTFPSREEAKNFLARELDCVRKEIEILNAHPDILKVPVAKKRILEIIEEGYNYALSRLYSNLDSYYLK